MGLKLDTYNLKRPKKPKEVNELPNYKWLYNIEPMQTAIINEWLVTRVPGGWIFTNRADESSDVFVPFNKEWQK